jgi:hypothetical protein
MTAFELVSAGLEDVVSCGDGDAYSGGFVLISPVSPPTCV